MKMTKNRQLNNLINLFFLILKDKLLFPVEYILFCHIFSEHKCGIQLNSAQNLFSNAKILIIIALIEINFNFRYHVLVACR